MGCEWMDAAGRVVEMVKDLGAVGSLTVLLAYTLWLSRKDRSGPS